MLLTDVDPFTAGSRAIVAALNAWQPWVDLFDKQDGTPRPGNIVDTASDDFNPLKMLRMNFAPGDYPRAVVMPGRFNGQPRGKNSLCTSIRQDYVLWIATDTLKTVPGNRIKWLTTVALLKAAGTLDQQFSRWEVIAGETYPLGGPSITGGESRWAAALTIRTEQDIARRDVAAL